MTPRHVYVHVPFCARRCSYCDFAIAVRREVPVAEYEAAVRSELDARGLGWGAPVHTLYLGGGTPSRLGAEGLSALVRGLAARIPLAADAEVTVEANPEDVTPEAAAAWRDAGVNRVSLGVQSFAPDVLAWMHRAHGPDRARQAVEVLREGGIDNISLDLIYAVPQALRRDWGRDLEEALALRPQHLSCYGLTVEPATPLARWVERGQVTPGREEAYEADFLATHDRLTAAGFEHYEVSNFAVPGFRSRHNASYWSGAAYVGIGPSAHGFDGRVRRWNRREYRDWRMTVAAGRDPVEGSETLTSEQQVVEAVYLGLRCDRGVPKAPGDEVVTDRWVEEGWAVDQDGVLRLTGVGWLRLDALATALTVHRSRY